MVVDASRDRESRVVVRQLASKLDDALARHLFDMIDTRDLAKIVAPEEQATMRRNVEALATKVFRRMWRQRLTPEEREQVINTVMEERVGFGPLAPLLQDPSVSEIMVNGPSSILVERRGRLEHTERRFRDRDHLLSVIERILAAVGRQISIAEPCVDAYLPDGSRVNIAIEPVAVTGPCVTIQKIARELIDLDQLIRLGTVTPPAVEFLRQCVRGRLNLVVSGQAAVGKTTMMNALLNTIPREERVVVIEDTPELHVPNLETVRLEPRRASLERRWDVTIRDLVRHALHMRPDRIVVGEVRGDEALDLLQALTTGHDGSMTTLHASAPRDVLERLATMALMAQVNLSPIAVERQTRSAVDLVVHLDRLGDGSRKVTHITEIRKGTEEPVCRDLFTLGAPASPGVPGLLAPTGARPAFLESLARRGVEIPVRLFVAPPEFQRVWSPAGKPAAPTMTSHAGRHPAPPGLPEVSSAG